MIKLTAEILEFGWNNPDPIFTVPLQASAKIVSSILEVNRMISDVISKEDLRATLVGFVKLIDEIVLEQIKTQLMISQKTGYDALCDELDYLFDTFKEFFEDKHGIGIELLRNSVKEIKHIKLMYLNN